MLNQSEGLNGLLRRELTRFILERLQGMHIEKAIEREKSDEQDPGASYEVEEMLNIPYMNRCEVPLAMDVFKPMTAEEQELPVIVTIHGGGLVAGDRTLSRRYARVLAGRGYLVFSLEYRLAPRASVAEQLDDVCAGMDLVGRKLVDFNVDFTRMFLAAESAGAYLAIYVAAMKQSQKLQQAIGYEPTRMVFKALGLNGGMFYTNRRDLVGWLLAEQFYGDKRTDQTFLQYMDPEHPEIIDNLPPVFLVTSRGDFLNNYTLMFQKALKRAGKVSHLLYYGEKELGHAFPTLEPYLEKSLDATGRMLAWFEEQAKTAERASGLEEEEAEKPATAEKRAGRKSAAAEKKEEKKPAAAQKRAGRKPAAGKRAGRKPAAAGKRAAKKLAAEAEAAAENPEEEKKEVEMPVAEAEAAAENPAAEAEAVAEMPAAEAEAAENPAE